MAQKKKPAAKEEFRKAAPKKKIQANRKSKVSKDFCTTAKKSKSPKAKKPKAPKVNESFYNDLAHMQSIFGRMGRGGIAGPGGCCIPPRRRRF